MNTYYNIVNYGLVAITSNQYIDDLCESEVRTIFITPAFEFYSRMCIDDYTDDVIYSSIDVTPRKYEEILIAEHANIRTVEVEWFNNRYRIIMKHQYWERPDSDQFIIAPDLVPMKLLINHIKGSGVEVALFHSTEVHNQNLSERRWFKELCSDYELSLIPNPNAASDDAADAADASDDEDAEDSFLDYLFICYEAKLDHYDLTGFMEYEYNMFDYAPYDEPDYGEDEDDYMIAGWVAPAPIFQPFPYYFASIIYGKHYMMKIRYSDNRIMSCCEYDKEDGIVLDETYNVADVDYLGHLKNYIDRIEYKKSLTLFNRNRPFKVLGDIDIIAF